MKTIIKSFALFAVAATAALSCQKNEIENPEQDTIHFTINADIAQTKTSIVNNGDGTYTPQWSNGDEIGVYFYSSDGSSSDGSLVPFTNGLDTGETARFEGNADVPEAGTLYAFYPYSSYGKKYEDGRVRLDLSATQYPSATSFDPNCDILVAKPQEYETISSNTVIADLSFARVMSVLKVNLKGEFEREQIVKSFSFTAEGVNLAGYAAMDLENAEITEWTNTTATSTVSAIYQTEDVQIGGTSNSVYLVVAPVDIPENTTLTFNVETDDYYISKTVSEHGKISFPSGNIAVIDLTINEENCTLKESIDYSGEWLITGTKADVVYAASAYTSGNNLKAYELTVYGNDKLIDKTEDIESCKMTLTKINEGSYKGKYTIQDANNLYLYAAGGESSNQLKAMNDISETDAGPYYWSILINEDGTYSVSANMTGRNKMLFNSASLLFSCYSSGQSPVTLIPYEKVVADPTPKIIVENAEIVVPASDTKATINYSIKNGSNGDVTVKVEDDATMTDVSAVASVGTVTVSFGTNNDETQKSAKIKLSYEGASDVYVTIIQEAAIAEGYVVDVLDRAFTGVSGTTYTSWSGVESTSSSAVYAGNSAGGNSSIQLRSTNSNSGIVSTTSGGHAKKVVLEWNSSTSQGRTLNIYGSNTQYSAATDLYETETQGTLLGTIVCGTSTELKIDGDYKYIGLRSNSGAMYLTKVEITWKETE